MTAYDSGVTGTYTFAIIGPGSGTWTSGTVAAPSGPTVTDAKISITSTPTGTSSTYKVGDTVTARWDDSASGDNQSGITGVTMDFSAFGGGSTVTATNDGSGHWTASYQIASGSIDGTNKNVSVTATNGSGSTTTADTTNLKVDNQAPTITAAKISISGATGTGGAFKVGDTVSASWNATGDGNSDIAASGVNMDFSAFGGGTVAATNSSGTWTATYTIVDGSIDGTNKNVSVTGTDDAGNSTSFTGTNNKIVDNIKPTVTTAKISVSGATGTGGAFKVGDTVTASWDNSGTGDNNADTISSATVDFSQFGGGAAVAATNSSGTWTATYVIASGSIDTTNRNVSVTATDNAGNATTTAGTNNKTVDNQPPTVTAAKIAVSGASGTGGAFKIGDTVTATWNNSGSGDNNADTISGVTMDFSQFGGGSAVTATNSGGTWTATYSVVSGSINGTTNRNISVTATDNAGNTTTTAGTGNKTVDNVLPVITSVALNTSTYKIGDTVTATITVSSDSDSYTLTGGSATIAGFTFGNLTKTAATTYTATYTVQSGDTDLISGSPTVNVVLVDGRGNASSAYTTTVSNAPITINAHAPTDVALSNSSVSTTGGTNAVVGNLSSTDATTGETFSYALVAGAGSTDNASFNISSGNLRANDPNALGAGTYSVRVRSTDAAGNTFDKVLSVTAVAGASVASPTVNEDTDSGAISITKGNAETYYKITGITGGTLYSDAAYTQAINNGDFVAQGGGGGNGTTTNVYFRPTANRNSANGGNGSFVLQASSSNADAGLTGPQVTGTVTLTPVADTPSVSNPTIAEDATSQAITITRSANDGAETTHYKVTGITGGTLYSDAGLTTQINSNDFVASGGATTTVYFKPTANWNSTKDGNASFVVQASSSNANGGLGGSTATSTIIVTPVADTPSVASPTVNEDTDTGAIAITRAAGDGSETSHYKITGITGGTLYSDAGYTTQINNGDFIASAGGTTNVYFRPTANRNTTTGGNGSFTVQASKSNADAGLGGSTVISTVALTPIADTPSVTNANTTPSTQTSSGLVLSRAVVDGTEVTYFKITGITNGNLFKTDGTTQINNGDFITFAEGNAGLKFMPTGGGDGSFTAQASTSNANGGLGGSTINATIAVGAAVANATVNEDTDTGAVAITKGGSETYYKVTGITGGTLYRDAAFTQAINSGDFIAQGGGGGNGTTTNVYFRPTANRNSTTGGNGSFTVQASGSNADAGLTGNQISSTITLTPIADTPSVTNATTAPNTQSASGLVLSRATVDGAEVTYFKITGITGGNLYKNDGTTQIANGTFLTFAEGNAGLKFTPSNGSTSGSFVAQASTSNANGGLGGSTVTANIVVNSAPVAAGGALTPPGGQVGAAYTFAIPNGTFTDPDAGDTLSYSASGLPTGLTINATTGAISGNPSAAGTASVTITATDSHGATATKTGSITIQAAPAPAPAPAPTPAPTPTVEPTPAPKVDPLGDPNSKDKGADGLRTVVRDTGSGTGSGTGTGLGTGTGFGPTVSFATITIPTVTTPTANDAPAAGARTTQSAGQVSAQAAATGIAPASVTIIPAVTTIAAPNAFQVAVASKPAGAGDALVVNAPLKDAFVVDGRISVTVPHDAFADTKANATVTLAAQQLNGAALPSWMSFNPQTGTFEGTPPPGFKGEVVVKVVARDNDGREAVQTFKIVVGEGNQGRTEPGQGAPQGQGQDGRDRTGDTGSGTKHASAKPMGKISLSEQLRAMSKEGRLAKQAALFSNLKTGGKAA
ncbi:putative Ig domain-containing protein [Paramagnetospirillum magneticum]|nr:putative Ig domain-containing protein [Paramagnetospirillum magneticum]